MQRIKAADAPQLEHTVHVATQGTGSPLERYVCTTGDDERPWWTLEVSDALGDDAAVRIIPAEDGSPITEPTVLRTLAGVLIARARELELAHPGLDGTPGERDVRTLLSTWEVWAEPDHWDLIDGVAGAMRVLAPLRTHHAAGLLAALNGDRDARAVWEDGLMTTADVADVLRVPHEELEATLTRWASDAGD